MVATTFATAVLGALYWAIAARRYSSSDVGVNASLISTMMFLTNLASLNFTDVLNRFVPVSGRSTRRLVLVSYAVAMGLGLVTSLVFLIGAHVWAPWLSEVMHGPGLGLVYVVATMLWVVFVLQDAVLIGLRRATYVLVENTGFGVLKIALLLALAAVVPGTGIFLSWTAPLLVIVVVVNVIVFGRLIPKHENDLETTTESIDRRQVGRFLAADYVAALSWTASIAGMPVVVLWTSGASASAYVYLAWTVAYTLYLVSRNFGMALTVEGARDPAELGAHVRASLLAAGRIVVPLAVLLTAAAPLVLQVFGSEYADNATGLIRLLLLSAIPAIVPTVYVSAARVQRRLAAMVWVTVLSTLPVLVLTPVLVDHVGIAGVGWAWLSVQAVMACALLLGGVWNSSWFVVVANDDVRVAGGSGERGDDLPAPVSEPVAVVFRARTTALAGPEVDEQSTAGAGGSGGGDDVLATTTQGDDASRTESDVDAASMSESPDRDGAGWTRRLARWPYLTLGGGVACWAAALAGLGARPVGDYGLLSGLPVVYFVALGLALGGAIAAVRRDAGWGLVVAHALLLVAIIHATPVLGYPELRYAWAWRHVGLVDLMGRANGLTPGVDVLAIYQHWPGFFGAGTTLTETSGLMSVRTMAAWAPPLFEAGSVLALVFLFRSLTDDRRRIGIAVILFVVTNWVGQDYFSPQAFTFFLYLVVLGIVLRWYQRPSSGSSQRRPLPASQRRALAFVVLVLMAAVVVSHPLTPLVLCLALVALTVTRVLDRTWPAVLMVAMTVVWFLTGARGYASQNLTGLTSDIGRFGANVDSNLTNLADLSPAQRIVADMGRGVVVLIGLLAVIGAIRLFRARQLGRAVVVLTLVPLGVLAGGSYGGEAVFRVYLFGLPFAVFLAAGCFLPTRERAMKLTATVAFALAVVVFAVGFHFAYFGKDAWAFFTPREVRAVEQVLATAPRDSLIIDGTSGYPTQFRNVGKFTYVTLAAEPRSSIRAVLADPVGELGTWMNDPAYRQTYFIVTRSQVAEANATGVLPRGSLERMRDAMLGSDNFTVLIDSPDVVVLTVKPGAMGAGP